MGIQTPLLMTTSREVFCNVHEEKKFHPQYLEGLRMRRIGLTVLTLSPLLAAKPRRMV